VKRSAIAGIALAGVALVAVVWLWASAKHPAAPEATTSSATVATVTTTQASAPTARTSSPVPVATAVPAPAVPVRLDSPKETVETQIALLRADRDDDLRATFATAISDDDLAYCKQKVRTRPVRPDWEMAEDGVTPDGHPIRRVSMFGKSMTGFVESAPGQWLADSVWCTQGRLP
jgi:type IV secretory pathway VirB10-like protein